MDFYEHLGVPRNASADDIKKAYRQKARAHHPDMHSGEDEQKKHAEIFKKVVEAFEILSDPEKKARYDSQGYWGRRPSTPPPPKPKSPVKTKEDFEQEKKEKNRKDARGRSRFEKEPMEVHCFFFGGESSGRSILVHVKLTPQEMKHGCTKSVTIKKRDFCQTCGGDGYGYFVCPKCRGKQQMICSYCDFTGGIDGKCPDCDGTGMGKWMLDEVVFKVSPNTQPGHSVTILGQGEHAPKKAPGNVRVVVL